MHINSGGTHSSESTRRKPDAAAHSVSSSHSNSVSRSSVGRAASSAEARARRTNAPSGANLPLRGPARSSTSAASSAAAGVSPPSPPAQHSTASNSACTARTTCGCGSSQPPHTMDMRRACIAGGMAGGAASRPRAERLAATADARRAAAMEAAETAW
jgi:hypothetical protein